MICQGEVKLPLQPLLIQQGSVEQKWSFRVVLPWAKWLTFMHLPQLVSHWIPAASRRTRPWTSRLSVAEAKPGGAGSIASSWNNKSYY